MVASVWPASTYPLWVAKTPWLAKTVDFAAPSAKLLDHVSFGVDRPSRPGQWIPAPSAPHARKSGPAPSAFGAPAFGAQAQAQDCGTKWYDGIKGTAGAVGLPLKDMQKYVGGDLDGKYREFCIVSPDECQTTMAAKCASDLNGKKSA